MKNSWKLAFSAIALSTAIAPLQAMATDTTSQATTAANQTTATPIKHTLVIYQENRSFDNYFGTYPTAPGFTALPGTPAVNGIPADSYNLDSNGNKVAPYLFPADQMKTLDVDHGYTDMIKSYDNGLMDKFYASSEAHTKGSGVVAMGYYDYHAIPAYWQLAQHFALADNWFQPVFGPSTPGALYLVAAQSGTKDKPVTGDPGPKNNFGGDAKWPGLDYNLTYKNIGDELTAAGRSWAWYQGGYAAKDDTYSAHHNPFQYFQNYEDGKYSNNLKDATDLFKDISNGTLPEVSYLKADYPNDEHPNNSTPAGEDYAVKAINAIMNSPYWKDTAIIITYDESGGYWDHVAPPQVTSGPDGLQGDGPRIPALVISPYAKRNYVSHVQYDTTSILKFIETNYGVPALNNRDANAANLNDMFNFNQSTTLPYMYNDATPTSKNGQAVSVQLNNALLGSTSSTEAPFINKEGVTMVPLADFATSVNGTVSYDNNKNQVIAKMDGKVFRFNVHSKEAFVNGTPMKLDAHAWVSPTNHTYVSLRSLVDALGWSLSYADGKVTVTSK